ncbi:MAG: hypothetical protein IJQ21_03935 [Lachnospiraceae bacterium]|nr:hypothetical protein [Lachnospiraceae bacterium]
MRKAVAKAIRPVLLAKSGGLLYATQRREEVAICVIYHANQRIPNVLQDCESTQCGAIRGFS